MHVYVGALLLGLFVRIHESGIDKKLPKIRLIVAALFPSGLMVFIKFISIIMLVGVIGSGLKELWILLDM